MNRDDFKVQQERGAEGLAKAPRDMRDGWARSQHRLFHQQLRADVDLRRRAAPPPPEPTPPADPHGDGQRPPIEHRQEGTTDDDTDQPARRPWWVD